MGRRGGRGIQVGGMGGALLVTRSMGSRAALIGMPFGADGLAWDMTALGMGAGGTVSWGLSRQEGDCQT